MKTMIIIAVLTVSAVVLPRPTISIEEIQSYIDSGALVLITDGDRL